MQGCLLYQLERRLVNTTAVKAHGLAQLLLLPGLNLWDSQFRGPWRSISLRFSGPSDSTLLPRSFELHPCAQGSVCLLAFLMEPFSPITVITQNRISSLRFWCTTCLLLSTTFLFCLTQLVTGDPGCLQPLRAAFLFPSLPFASFQLSISHPLHSEHLVIPGVGSFAGFFFQAKSILLTFQSSSVLRQCTGHESWQAVTRIRCCILRRN